MTVSETTYNSNEFASPDNLIISYQKINYYFTGIVFITTLLVASADTLTYLLHKFHFLFYINIILLTALLTDLGLFITKKISTRKAFIFLLCITLTNISLTHIYEIRYDNFLAKTVLIGLWGLLFIVLTGIVLTGWYTYMVMLWADLILIFDALRTGDDFLWEVVPAIIVALAGISYGISIYMSLLKKSFQRNLDIFLEVAKQKNIVEKQAQDLIEANSHLKELQHLQKDLTEMIVHDMKNPLNSILSFSAKEPSTKDYRQIHESGRQMLLLVENMLGVQRMEATSLNYAVEPLQFKEILKIALHDVDYLAIQRSIKFVNQTSFDYYILADKDVLERVLINLLTNAIKHSPVGAQISIGAELIKNNELAIRIEDQGDGIPDQLKDHVFGKFVQLVPRKLGFTNSTGLGLTFCKRSIECMKGKIWIEDSEPKGTIVSFTLPLANKNILRKKVKTQNEGLSIHLTKKDISTLTPLALKLQSLDVFKGGLILYEIAQFGTTNKKITAWTEELKKAVYGVNQLYYTKMLEMVLSLKT